MAKKEEWRDIVGYEGRYQVSDMGRIKSLSRKIFNGIAYWVSKDRILKQNPDSRGYLTVNLYIDNKSKAWKVHKLVAIAFFGHEPCGMSLVINHKNALVYDNRVENLEETTQRENSSTKSLNANKGTTSIFFGVYWNIERQKWHARIYINGKHINLGYFDIEEDAGNAYKEAVENENNPEYFKLLKERNKPIYSSKYEYISFNKDMQKWKASLKKIKHLGYFDTEEIAYEVQQKAVKEYNLNKNI